MKERDWSRHAKITWRNNTGAEGNFLDKILYEIKILQEENMPETRTGEYIKSISFINENKISSGKFKIEFQK